MNEQMLMGKWKEIKGDIQSAWAKLSGDELERSKGNIGSISGLIEQKYGLTKDEVSAKLKGIMARYEHKNAGEVDTLKRKVADTTETIKDKMKESKARDV